MPTTTSLPRLRTFDRGSQIDQIDSGLSAEIKSQLKRKGIRSAVSLLEVVSADEAGFSASFGISTEDVRRLSQLLAQEAGDCLMSPEQRDSLMAVECPLDDVDCHEADTDLETVDSDGLAAMPDFAADPEVEKSLLSANLPIRNQQKRGTCVSFATTRAFEVNGLRQGNFDQAIDCSEHFMHWNTKQNYCTNRNVPGTKTASALKALANLGICTETLCTYESQCADLEHKGAEPSSDAYRDAEQRKHPGSVLLKGNDLQAIKKAIANGCPVIFSMPVFKQWYHDPQVRDSGVLYSQVGDHDTVVGGHAVLLVGYIEDEDAPDESYFIFDNSWGTGWAPSSFFGPGRGILPFAYVVDHCATKSAFVLTN